MQTNEDVVALPTAAPRSAEPTIVDAGAGDARQQISLNALSSEADHTIALASLLQRLLGPALTFISLGVSARAQGETFAGAYPALGLVAALLVFILFRQAAINQFWRRGAVGGLVTHIAGSWLMVIGFLILFGAATGTLLLYAKPAVYVWLVLAPILLLVQQLITRLWLLRRTRIARNARRAIVVGLTPLSVRLMREIETSPNLGIQCCGVFDDRDPDRLPHDARRYLRGWLRELPDYVKRERVHVIYITLPMVQQARIVELLDRLRDTTASIYFVPDPFAFDLIQGRIAGINGLPAVAVCESPFIGIDGVVKRVMDAGFALLALLALAPVFAVLALGVKLGSPGPVFFKQRRYGIYGEEIMVFKFRSMVVCEDGARITQAQRGDARVTPFGAFLRRTSLDELPQLLNVLRGEMSLVGPRPHAVAHNEEYRKLIKGYMLRHKVRPGITGWAQVNGYRGETPSLDKMRHRVEYDLDYLRNWSLLLDLKIICKTLWIVFRDRHAY